MAKISGGRQLAKINKENPELGALLARLIDGQNHGFGQLGVDPVGQASAPPPPDGLEVGVTGETAHFRVTNNSPVSRATKTFVEIHTDPQFTAPKMVLPLSASRDAAVPLPVFSSMGVMQDYYARTYTQTAGSPPSKYIPYPTYITMQAGESGAGTTGDLLPSAGSGTSAANGTQSHQGYGEFQTRKATAVKRQVG